MLPYITIQSVKTEKTGESFCKKYLRQKIPTRALSKKMQCRGQEYARKFFAVSETGFLPPRHC
jgi:hypothetical protein